MPSRFVCAFQHTRGVCATGVYVLGPSEHDSSQLRVYMGETDVLSRRLDQHHAQTDFWTRAVVFTSKDDVRSSYER